MPAPLRDRPTILEPLQLVWRAFWDLNASRTVEHVASLAGSFTMRGAIPYEAKALWLERHGVVDPDDLAWHEQLLTHMDNVYGEVQSQQVAGRGGGDDVDD